MFCVNCGTRLDEDAQFCSNCGSPIASPADPSIEQEPNTQQPYTQIPVMPPYQPNMDAPQTASTQQPIPQKPTKNNKKKIIALVSVLAAIIVLAVVGVLAWWFISGHNDSAAQESTSAQSQNSATDTEDDNDSDTSDATAKNTDKKQSKKQNKTCATSLQFEPKRVRAQESDHTAVVAGTFTTSCDAYTLDSDNVEIRVSDQQGIIAAAVFDFSEQPIELTDGESGSVSLAFTQDQSFIPAHESTTTVQAKVTLNSPTKSESSAPTTLSAGRRFGASILTDDEIEQASKHALQREINSDKQAAQSFMTTYTTQLSSKIEGMTAEGKTWTSKDIWEEFINYTTRHPQARLLWSADWPTYTKHSNGTNYYVIISGESFGSIDSGEQWCAQQGYNQDNCMVVDLQ